MQSRRRSARVADTSRVGGWLDAVTDGITGLEPDEDAVAPPRPSVRLLPTGLDAPTSQFRAEGPSFWTELGSQLSPELMVAGENLVDRLLGQNVGSVTVAEVDEVNDAMLAAVAGDGLGHWIEAVRKHHDATYQHCMLVNGIAGGFARLLGFSRVDCLRFTLAAALHDIGKSRVPLTILDKPSRLSDDEFAVIARHPLDAADMLAGTEGVDDAVMDAVQHHHEYLDGSGYPHRLSGGEVQDMSRLLTIVDIFAALIERRSYKAPIAPAKAYAILCGMDGKLDRALLHAFRAVPDLLRGLD